MPASLLASTASTATLAPSTEAERPPLTELEFLDTCVAEAVGPGATARPGQAQLAAAIAAALAGRTHTIGKAPTGVGKSMPGLGIPAYRAALFGERSVVSTQSLTLQDQYLNKDWPAIQRAASKHLGAELKAASLKGANNYIDPRRMAHTAAVLLDDPGVSFVHLGALADTLPRLKKAKAEDYRARLQKAFGPHIDAVAVKKLLIWAIDRQLDFDAPGDRQSCDIVHSDREWFAVAAMSAEAVADSDKWGFETKAQEAKIRASEADIVIVHHVLLAIQAAKGLNIVIGNSTIGRIDHLIIDEAHTLPSAVRDQGASTFSGGSFRRVENAISGVIDRTERSFRAWANDGEDLAQATEQALSRFTGKRLTDLDHPLGVLEESIEGWIEQGKGFLPSGRGAKNPATMIAQGRADAAIAAVLDALASTGEHRVGQARWVESPAAAEGERKSWTSIAASPVYVGGMLRRQLWLRDLTEIGDESVKEEHLAELPPLDAELDPEPRLMVRLGVAAMSATMSPHFGFEAKLDSPVIAYDSPFTDQYAASCLHVPAASTPELMAELTDAPYGKPRLSLLKHVSWARAHALRMVQANGGRALLLTAKSNDGKALAEYLRARLSVAVYSQWDGEAIPVITAKWKADETSVLVGTKSLMTGVDAPGETCSLVWIDRPPRKPTNPVDDARVESLIEQSFSRFDAIRMVYVSDAALELEQAVGRLIRGMRDGGLAVICDPRLAKGTPISYSELDRQTYMNPFAKFGVRFAGIDRAEAYLHYRRQLVRASA